MDNMKISEILTNPNPEINRTTQSSNDTFKFMLVSNIAEQELQQKIGGLMSQIDEQGKKISKKKDIRDRDCPKEILSCGYGLQANRNLITRNCAVTFRRVR